MAIGTAKQIKAVCHAWIVTLPPDRDGYIRLPGFPQDWRIFPVGLKKTH